MKSITFASGMLMTKNLGETIINDNEKIKYIIDFLSI